MCGRTACTLDPQGVQRACTYQNRAGRKEQPTWKDSPGGQQYYPSHNIAPGSFTPVLLSRKHLQGQGEKTDGCEDERSERVVMPMQWGLVPSWHKGDPKSVMYNMNNCRSDGMLQKKSFKGPLEKGRRCVVLADGFFEWKRDKSEKQPYFIYFPQSSDIKGQVKEDVEEISEDEKPATEEVKPTTEDLKPNPEDLKPAPEDLKPNPEDLKSNPEDLIPVPEDLKPVTKDKPCSEDLKPVRVKPENDFSRYQLATDKDDSGNDLSRKRLLTMAGVFDVWKPNNSADPLYSYSVITVDASPAVSWIHDRMPAMLTTEEEVEQWLEFGDVPLQKAVQVIRPVECLQSHPVSSIVNNSRNKSPDCVKPIDLTKKLKPSASSTFMMNWLTKGKKQSPLKDSNQEPPSKKMKT